MMIEFSALYIVGVIGIFVGLFLGYCFVKTGIWK
jgi:hypothetical protein